jgi:hypothetical protein
MATFIKSTCTECSDTLQCSCNGCGKIQHALGLDDSVTSISFQVTGCEDPEVLYFYYDCAGLGATCDEFTLEVGSQKLDNQCVIKVGLYREDCRGEKFYPGPISLPFTASGILIQCESGDSFTASVTLS